MHKSSNVLKSIHSSSFSLTQNTTTTTTISPAARPLGPLDICLRNQNLSRELYYRRRRDSSTGKHTWKTPIRNALSRTIIGQKIRREEIYLRDLLIDKYTIECLLCVNDQLKPYHVKCSRLCSRQHSLYEHAYTPLDEKYNVLLIPSCSPNFGTKCPDINLYQLCGSNPRVLESACPP